MSAEGQTENNGYEIRQAVPAELQSWDTLYPDYLPPDFTSQKVLIKGPEEGWADHEDPRDVDFSLRPSLEGEVRFDPVTNRPLTLEVDGVYRAGVT